MNYIELNFTVTSKEFSEILVAELADFPFESFETEPLGGGSERLRCYIPQDELADYKAVVDGLLARYEIGDARYISIESQNWNAQWESNFERVEVGDKLLIRAPFHDADPSFAREVVIMPKMSFGTGHHSTTHLMAEWATELVGEGDEVLDMGSGTGVLAIVAAKCGAAHVDAVDIDEWADENCRENIAVNGVEGVVTPMLGDFARIAGRSYNIILANINRNILVGAMAQFVAALRDGATLVVSGFLEQDIDHMRSAVEQHGLSVAEVRVREGWVAMKITK